RACFRHLRLCPRWRPRCSRTPGLSFAELLLQFPEAAPHRIDHPLRRLGGLLLEAEQHVDDTIELCCVNSPVGIPVILDPDFPDALSDIRHRLPVMRQVATLHPLQVITDLPAWLRRKA